jgi:hypothetical protein
LIKEQFDDIRKDLEENGVPASDALAKIAMKNSIEPAFIFRVD